jgi:hypothetical protein
MHTKRRVQLTANDAAALPSVLLLLLLLLHRAEVLMLCKWLCWF